MDTRRVTPMALLLPAAESAGGVPWADLGRALLLLTLTASCYVVVALVSPTTKCPVCKGEPYPHGLCPRCQGLRRIPRFASRLIHRGFRLMLRRLAERRRDRLAERRSQ